MEATMARAAKRVRRQRNEQIDIREFEDISIRFPSDVYILATWMAMSDMAKSTPTCQPHTTLHGLARSFAMLHGTDYSNPLNAEDVMAVFRKHGISGNPTLRLETTREE
jgi:sucrose-6-phosphate hydrolase SacC (GH32 family)